ncbi:hypothetical protein JIQ42_05968 [Leishmania sp. Namibia]|uniref:hypothetical protein n=1 Tax=Leishmania sp. Namibia TaxID=2802991 RepID=UPI001B5BA256|nr:hypothetical protein JIQ42_05968 [Leishmania sp. Namibia]
MSTGSLSVATLQYFESKGIQSILDEAMHNLMLEMPEDPLAFLEEAFRRPTPVHVILTGPRGSGKTTLAGRLGAHYGIVHVAAPTAAATDVAMPADVLRELRGLQKEGKGWVLDGFPQTRADVIQLQTSGISPQLVFELQVPPGVAVRRAITGAADSPGHPEDAAAVAKCHELYDVRRMEVITSYRPCYRGIDATGTADEVAADVVRAIDALHLS